jgi:hypothetical protein
VRKEGWRRRNKKENIGREGLILKRDGIWGRRREWN